jgi:hypothetical protein
MSQQSLVPPSSSPAFFRFYFQVTVLRFALVFAQSVLSDGGFWGSVSCFIHFISDLQLSNVPALGARSLFFVN